MDLGIPFDLKQNPDLYVLQRVGLVYPSGLAEDPIGFFRHYPTPSTTVLAHPRPRHQVHYLKFVCCRITALQNSGSSTLFRETC